MPHGNEAEKAPARPQGRWERFLITVRTVVWPTLVRFAASTFQTLRSRFVPAVGSGAARLRSEAVKIHRSQNWMQRCGATLSGNAAGLAVAMLSTRVVESMVETREASNLWGLLADRPIVSKTTFEVLSFVVEYLLALVIFAITEYYIAEYRRRRAATSAAVTEGES